MSTLQDRLAELLRITGWDRRDLMRITGMSSSVVSQWEGKGGKPTKSIGNMQAALKLEAASGYSALWLAKGEGPKMAQPATPAPHTAQQATAPYRTADVISVTALERQLLLDLRVLLPDDQQAIALDASQRAQRARQYAEHITRMAQPKSMAAKKTRPSSELRFTHGDGIEGQAALAFVQDPHEHPDDDGANATARAQREDAMYGKIDAAFDALHPTSDADAKARR